MPSFRMFALALGSLLAVACTAQVVEDPIEEPAEESQALGSKGKKACDPTLICGDALTCVDGQLYPTTCGPKNCDKPIGPCNVEPSCDPTLICGQALTCVGGQLYPTTCGPLNCDKPIGPCSLPQDCDPTLLCGQALTCVGDQLYPTTCGPENCDQPIGPCYQ